MKYADYKVKDLVFLTKEDWTEEEMKEVLDTFPESNQTEQIRGALNNVIEAIDNEIIKTNRWGEINKQSARAYANKHNYLMYGNGSGYWYSINGLYIRIDGEEFALRYKSDVEKRIQYLDDIKKRFKNICNKYVKSEERYKKEKETNDYETANRERIIANRIASCYLSEFEIKILKNFKKYKYLDEVIPEYTTETKRIRGNDFAYYNHYGEIEFHNKVLSKEDAEKITEIIKEANRKAELIMDRVNIELREIKEKYNES